MIPYNALLTQCMDDNAVDEAWSLTELGSGNSAAGVLAVAADRALVTAACMYYDVSIHLLPR
jgi:hypothetical protein